MEEKKIKNENRRKIYSKGWFEEAKEDIRYLKKIIKEKRGFWFCFREINAFLTSKLTPRMKAVGKNSDRWGLLTGRKNTNEKDASRGKED